MRSAWSVALAPVLVVLSGVQHVAAESPDRWEAPPGCPQLDEVGAMVGEIVGRQDAPAEVPEMEGTVRRASGGMYQLELRVAGEHHWRMRTLEHDDCQALTEAAALLMALTIDPNAVVDHGEGQSDGEPAAAPGGIGRVAEHAAKPPPMESTQTAAEPVTTEARRRGRVPTSTADPLSERYRSQVPLRSVGVGVHGALESGVLPGWGDGEGVHLLASLRLPLQVEATLTSWRERTQGGPRPGAEVRLSMVSGALRGCWLHGMRWQVALCAGPEWGRIAGRGDGLDVERGAWDWWTAATTGVRARYFPLGWLGLQVGMDGLASLGRPTFNVQGWGEAHRPAAWVWRAQAGLVLRRRLSRESRPELAFSQ